VARLVLAGTLAVTAVFCLLGVPLSMLAAGGLPPRDLLLNAMAQAFFAKLFGVLVLTAPIVVLAHLDRRRAAGRPWWRAALPWPVLLVGIALPAALVWPDAAGTLRLLGGPALAGFEDYRFFAMAALLAAVFTLPARWTMAALVGVQMLLVGAMTSRAEASDDLPGLFDLFRVGAEVLLLQLLVLLLLVLDRRARSQRRRLLRMGRREPLSGLPNLHALREQWPDPAPAQGLGVLLLDHSDRVSASLGVGAQAALLRALARHLAPGARVFPVASNELAVLSSASADPWPTVLQRAHAFEFSWDGQRVRSLPYLGIARPSTPAEGADALLLRASQAAHRARAMAETEPLDAASLSPGEGTAERVVALQRDSDLLALLRGDEVELFLQPVVRLDGTATGLSGEVLCRLRGADGEPMSPAGFIPALQARGRLVELDLAVLRALGQFLQARRDRLPPIGKLAINLSGQSLASSAFASALRRQLAALPLPPSCVWLELTETAAITDAAKAGALIAELRAAGYGIALDDFGIGFQSFERLRQIPVDLVKIDGSFVRGLHGGGPDDDLIRATVIAARAFGAETAAEWIEDARSAEALRALGVQWGQGQHFGLARPLEAWFDR
jgi:EAL domain-containing protein (putative c-di-GMP-specific phosphodiesterase class I)